MKQKKRRGSRPSVADVPDVEQAAPDGEWRTFPRNAADPGRPLRRTAKLRAMLRARRFVAAFVAGPEEVRGNSAQSARVAGFRSSTPGAMAVRGATMLARPQVRRMIERHMDRVGATAERILAETAAVAFADLRDVAEWDEGGVTMFSSKLLDDATAAAIQEVEQHSTKEGVRVRVKLHDKIRALDLLAKLRRVIGDDAPREFTLVIGRAGSVSLTAGAGGEPPVALVGAESSEDDALQLPGAGAPTLADYLGGRARRVKPNERPREETSGDDDGEGVPRPE